MRKPLKPEQRCLVKALLSGCLEHRFLAPRDLFPGAARLFGTISELCSWLNGPSFLLISQPCQTNRMLPTADSHRVQRAAGELYRTWWDIGGVWIALRGDHVALVSI
ncbi:hypothetical protein NDU88_006341 [Pleurodeles waltl]|uniref:Uncharacterized protein n=1 Tax=Pleurodeles waltl TaxID=8319 RepID=A0AAV7QIR9_PLEWA|nr:hypothetical protein NDU88_006341 [Pleurodeles waltl]